MLCVKTSVCAIWLLMALCLTACSSNVQDVGLAGLAPTPAHHEVFIDPTGKTHFVEFRAVMPVFPGHSYFIHGQLDNAGNIVRRSDPIGFYPFLGPVGGSTLGLVAIPGSTAPDASDLRSPVKERFRVELTATQHARLMRFLARWRKGVGLWNLVFNNCNDFVADAARSVGLEVPAGPNLMPPNVHIRELRELNQKSFSAGLRVPTVDTSE